MRPFFSGTALDRELFEGASYFLADGCMHNKPIEVGAGLWQQAGL